MSARMEPNLPCSSVAAPATYVSPENPALFDLPVCLGSTVDGCNDPLLRFKYVDAFAEGMLSPFELTMGVWECECPG